jgi:hypothetical protein
MRHHCIKSKQQSSSLFETEAKSQNMVEVCPAKICKINVGRSPLDAGGKPSALPREGLGAEGKGAVFEQIRSKCLSVPKLEYTHAVKRKRDILIFSR